MLYNHIGKQTRKFIRRMAAIICGISAATIVTSASTNVLVGMLTTTITTVGAYTAYITSYDQPCAQKVSNELAKIDLDFLTSVIQSLIEENKDKEVNDSIKYAIYGVNETLENIQDDLRKIKTDLEEHKEKYFSSWRSFSCSSCLEAIKFNKQILDKRYHILLELLKIYSK